MTTNTKIKFLTSPRSGEAVKNQIVIITLDEQGFTSVATFNSYGKDIVRVNYENRTIEVSRQYYDYSRTTGKYRNQFFDYLGFYELNNLPDLRKAIEAGECEIAEATFKVTAA